MHQGTESPFVDPEAIESWLLLENGYAQVKALNRQLEAIGSELNRLGQVCPSHPELEEVIHGLQTTASRVGAVRLFRAARVVAAIAHAHHSVSTWSLEELERVGVLTTVTLDRYLDDHSETDGQIELIDEATFKDLLETVRTPDYARDVVEAFRTQIRKTLEEIEVSQSIEDEGAIRSALHRLEGSAATVGAKLVVITCRDLQGKTGKELLCLPNERWCEFRRISEATVELLLTRQELTSPN